MFKSILIGIGAGFLGLAGAAATPVIVGIMGAFGGATAIVGVGVWRAVRKMQRAKEEARLAESALGAVSVSTAKSR